MSDTERQAIKEKYCAGALRYMDNATKTLLALGAYDVLRLSGYYDGRSDARVIKAGFDTACSVIEKIKPLQTS
ncbi:MAG: hypothetical protein LBH19_00985 [Dysgonamonadaceae bacterium]|jgi:hypothetical protein|nr:hypothetical protein [Dysgonamonadaceae bacterium]